MAVVGKWLFEGDYLDTAGSNDLTEVPHAANSSGDGTGAVQFVLGADGSGQAVQFYSVDAAPAHTTDPPGLNGYVELSNTSPTLEALTSGFTITAFVRPDTPAAWIFQANAGSIVTLEGADCVVSLIVIPPGFGGATDYRINFVVGDGAAGNWGIYSPEGSLSSGVWSGVTAVYNPATGLSLTIDGTTYSDAIEGTTFTLTDWTRIAVGASADSFAVDDVILSDVPGAGGGTDPCTGRRTIPVDLLASLRAGCMRLAVCVKITRQDGTIFGFTTHDRMVNFEGQDYSPSSGIAVSALRQQIGLAVSNFEVTGSLLSGGITASDLRKGLYDGATVEVYMAEWSNPSLGFFKLQKGYVGDVTFGDADWSFEARSIAQRLAQPIGDVYTPTCLAELGDSRCGVDLTGFTFASVLSAVASNRLVTVAADSHASGYYDGGKLTFTSGTNSGFVAEIKTHVLDSGSALLTLQEPLPYTPSVGDTVTVQAGCLKRFSEDCKTKFANADRFRGFPTIPQASTTSEALSN